MVFGKIAGTATAVVALGVFLAAAPVGIDFSGRDGLGLQVGKAFAKDGKDKGGGNGGGGGSNNGNNGNGGGSSSNNGNNGNRGGDDKGGHGNDDRGGGGSSGRGGGDDRGGDDNGGRGRGGGDDSRVDDLNDAVEGGGAIAAPGGGDLRVVKIERSASGIEIIYSNGVTEEVENGRYELKNAAGRTVVQRAATQSDFDRIGRNVRNSGLTPPQAGNGTLLPSGSQAGSVEVSGRNIEVRYVTGWKEAIEAGRYELKDPNNNTVVERPATTADRDRMLALAGG